MGRGVANHNIYQDYQYRTDNAVNLKLTYVRYLYPNDMNLRNEYHLRTVSYNVYIPRTWEAGDKWNSSIAHFKEKISRIEELLNDCKSPFLAE
jgi:hypothetical protein